MNQLRGYIEIGEGKVPFKFGTNAWARFCESRSIEFGDILTCGIFGQWKEEEVKGKSETVMVKAPDVLLLADLFFHAHICAGGTLTKDQVFDLLDESEGAFELLQQTMLRGKILGFSLSGDGSGKAETP